MTENFLNLMTQLQVSHPLNNQNAINPLTLLQYVSCSERIEVQVFFEKKTFQDFKCSCPRRLPWSTTHLYIGIEYQHKFYLVPPVSLAVYF